MIGTCDGTNTTFFMTDGLGSVVASFSNTSGSAAVLGNQTYEPYGKAQYQQGNRGTSKGYTGQYSDNLSGLDYYGARYYDPVAGVFLSPDRVQGNDSGMNPYAYVAGNPETLTDPTGNVEVNQAQDAAESVGNQGGNTGGGDPGGLLAALLAIGYWWNTHVGAAASGPLNCLRPDSCSPRFFYSHPSNPGSTSSITPPAPWGNGDPFVNNRDMPDDISTTQGLSFPAQPAPGTIVGFVNESDVLHVQGGTACSFTSATPVATPEGEKAIGDLQVGDKVMAYNPKTHQMEAEPVLHVWKHVDSDLIDLTITIETPAHDGKPATKQSEVIHTTSEHPFLTKEQGFTPAGKLKVGMHVQRADGSFGIVTGWKTVTATKTMYNLEVQQDHTFAVGDGEWVVHNECGPIDRKILRQNMENNGVEFQKGQAAHHIIPCMFKNHDLLQKAGFDVNEAYNGRALWGKGYEGNALADAEPWHAAHYYYNKYAEFLLDQANANLGSGNAFAAAMGVVAQLNSWINLLGMIGVAAGAACKLTGPSAL